MCNLLRQGGGRGGVCPKSMTREGDGGACVQGVKVCVWGGGTTAKHVVPHVGIDLPLLVPPSSHQEGKGSWSLAAVATTAACPPSSPASVGVVGSNRTSATLSWLPPSEVNGASVSAFEVQLQAKTRPAVEHMGPEWLKIFEGGAMACTINSLRAGCSYRARVRAANSAGWGQFCIPEDITTAPDVPDVPSPPAASTVTSVSRVGVKAWAKSG